MKPLTISLILICWGNVASADVLHDCLEKIKGSYDETMCYAEESARLDDLLEQKFSAMIEGMAEDYEGLISDPEKLTALKNKAKESHMYWRKYLETECSFAYDSIIGTGAPAETVHCRIKLIEHRLDELESYY